MNRIHWIICERSGEWASAIRLAVNRANWPPQTLAKIVEVRRFSELSARLCERPQSFALVEVHPANLADALIWLAIAERSHPQSCFAALADRAIVDGEYKTGADGRRLWTTLTVTRDARGWRIAAIRNMAPTGTTR